MKSLINFIKLLPVLAAIIACNPRQVVNQYGFYEVSFESEGTYNNPYTDVSAHAIIRCPDNSERTLPLFWDGGKQWKLRISPDQTGDWEYSIQSEDKGLKGKEGHFRCIPSKLTGSIQPMPGYAHHFAYQDGTPFLFWGDTGWSILQDKESEDLNREAVFHYIDQRSGQGINTIHCMLMNEAGWDNNQGMPFEDIGQEKINTAYWQEVDKRLSYLNKKGIIGGLMLAWGRKLEDSSAEPYAWDKFPNLEARKRYAEYIAARYGAYDVYFMVSGEWNGNSKSVGGNAEETLRKEFINIGDALKAADAHQRMIGIHPMAGKGLTREFNQVDWMSFADYQQSYWNLHGRILESRLGEGPVVNSEYGYFLRDRDDDGVADKHNSYTVDDMRHATWDIVMAGGYPITGFGSTYMGGYRHKGPFNVDDPRNRIWEEQYLLIKNFLSGLEWWKLEPHDEWLHSTVPLPEKKFKRTPKELTEDKKRDRVQPMERAYWLLAEPGKHYIAYLRGIHEKISISLNNTTSSPYNITLFNPRTGEAQLQKKGITSNTYDWIPPDSSDWVLCLSKNDLAKK
jgi:hypothetical protein